jgi:hypothetical protein
MLSVKSSFGGFTSPYVYKIPADTVIFYNGTYSAPVDGWELYSAATDKFIIGTTTQGEVGVVTAASGSTTATATSLSTAGAHSGNFNPPSAGGYTSLTTAAKVAGDHTHTISPTSASATSEIKPIHTKITMLRTTAEQKFFPVNTIHIGATNIFGGTQKLAATSDRYISGSTEVADGAATDQSVTLTADYYVSSHSHSYPPYDTYGGALTSSYQQNYDSGYDSAHTHVVTATASITALKGKLLKLWIAASKQLPKSSVVVMYCGDISTLPSYWKICDGTNGTVDMTGYFLGYATSAATDHGAVTSETNTYTTSGPTAASDPYTHAHYLLSYGYYTTTYRAHASQNVTHTHTVAGGSVTSDALPASIKLAFIQLVI